MRKIVLNYAKFCVTMFFGGIWVCMNSCATLKCLNKG